MTQRTVSFVHFQLCTQCSYCYNVWNEWLARRVMPVSCFQHVWHVWLAVEVCWRASSENCSAFEIFSSVVWCEPFIQYHLCIHYNISSCDWPPARAFPLQAKQTRRWEGPWICRGPGKVEGLRVSSWGLGSSFIGGHDKYIHMYMYGGVLPLSHDANVDHWQVCMGILHEQYLPL